MSIIMLRSLRRRAGPAGTLPFWHPLAAEERSGLPDGAATPSFDCTACGACCGLLDVLLTADDADRFESSPRLRVLLAYHPVGTGPAWPFMKRDPETGHCAALGGALGACRCTIYPDRPHLCRAFEVGSPDCLAARRAKGFADPPADGAA